MVSSTISAHGRLPTPRNKWLDQKDDLLAGRKPRTPAAGLTVRELANRYLTWKRHQLDTREIAARTFADCLKACERIVVAFGKTRPVSDLGADDFEALRTTMAKSLGPLALGIESQRIRAVFKYGHEAHLFDRPVRYGPGFSKPSCRVLRAERQKRGERMMEAAELRTLLAAAGQPMRAMILLALNARLGNRDIALLPLKALDLNRGWLTYPRPKTAVQRRAPLRQETVQALCEAIEKQPPSKDAADAGLVFITRPEHCWVRHSAGKRQAWTDSVGLEFGKLLRKIGLKREGTSFYSLRHVFRTIADETRDQPAIDAIMGHAADVSDMAAVYRERIGDDRLRDVMDTVHRWLFRVAADPAPTSKAAAAR